MPRATEEVLINLSEMMAGSDLQFSTQVFENGE